MPTLRFANLGPTPGDETTSVLGSLYVLMTEDSSTAVVFDLRTYDTLEGEGITFRRVGPFDIAILPRTRLGFDGGASSLRYPPLFGGILETVTEVYVVNFSEKPPAAIGWRHLRRLFPRARKSISRIPIGRTDWDPVREDEKDYELIQSIVSTGLVECGEKIEIGPFRLFLFGDKSLHRPSSVLITGETRGRPFTFFFGGEEFGAHFTMNRVRMRSSRLHRLSAGRWFAFHSPPSLQISLPFQFRFEITPVERPHGCT